jgi:predicted proteasome-type protease
MHVEVMVAIVARRRQAVAHRVTGAYHALFRSGREVPVTESVGMMLRERPTLPFASRPRADVGSISTLRRTTAFNSSGERALVPMTARIRAIAQSVASLREQRLAAPDTALTPCPLPNMLEAARRLCDAPHPTTRGRAAGAGRTPPFASKCARGAQIAGKLPRLVRPRAAGPSAFTESQCHEGEPI